MQSAMSIIYDGYRRFIRVLLSLLLLLLLSFLGEDWELVLRVMKAHSIMTSQWECTRTLLWAFEVILEYVGDDFEPLVKSAKERGTIYYSGEVILS